MRKIKFLALFFLIIISSIFTSCSLFTSYATKNFLTLGIQASVPNDIKFSFSESKIFNYQGTTVPTVTIQGINKKDDILFKSFPFTTDDYKNHFKSAFSGDNLKEIEYDYKEVKISNDQIEKVYKSKAILSVKGEKKYSYVYLVSFKNTSGTLIVETSSSSNNDFEKIIKSLKRISSKVENVSTKNSTFNTNRDLKNVDIIENITVPMPSSFTIKESKTNDVYYINGFGDNDAIYVAASKNKPIETTQLIWSNINGYEVLNEISKGCYLVHDLNTQKIYTLTTEIKEVTTSSNNKYYLRIEKLALVKK